MADPLLMTIKLKGMVSIGVYLCHGRSPALGVGALPFSISVCMSCWLGLAGLHFLACISWLHSIKHS